MVDIFVGFPGASAKEVEERVTKPMEKLLWRSRVSSNLLDILAQWRDGDRPVQIGENEENAIVRLNQRCTPTLT